MKATQVVSTLGLLVLMGGQVLAQGMPGGLPTDSPAASTKQWSFAFTADGYVVPHGRSYVNPNFTADRGKLHLEARYNYEDLDTGSFWGGYNLTLGQKLVLEATPMIGGLVGNTAGIAPGCTFALTYKRFELSSQGEYVFDTKDTSGSFFYNWSELTYSPAEWFRTGLAAQRTKAYHTSLNVQRGLLVGFSHNQLEFTTYVFNLGWTDPTLVFEIGLNF
jgi:hypothetical protein